VKIESLAGDIIVFSVRGEPDLGDELRAITEMVAGDVDSNVIIDFVCVDIIRSSSLTEMLKLRQVLVVRSRQLVLCNMHPLTQSIMEITDLNRVFVIVADKQAGVSLIRSSQFAHVS
jgi:anti-anti-sigma regulatory factor